MLTGKQKQIARAEYTKGFNLGRPLFENVEAAVEAAVEAVLAEQARAAEQGQETPKRSLSEVLEELCPGVRKRNWPAWAGPYTETDAAPLVTPKMTQDEDDAALPAQPPAGDVVERMLDAFMPGWKCEPSPERQRKYMTAALAVAREGYVSLDDVEKAIMDDSENWPGFDGWGKRFAANVLNRLSGRDEMRSEYDFSNGVRGKYVGKIAKPAEQTDENRVAEIISKRMQSFHCVDTTLDKIAAEIVAAMRDGREGK